MNKGRRTAMISMNLIGIIGCVLSVYPNYFVMIAGRALYCLAAGVLITVVPRIIEETIPSENFDHGFGQSTNLGIDFVVFVNSALVIFMPKLNKAQDNQADLKDSMLWKYLYFFPAPFMCISLFISVCCFRNETVGFLVDNAKEEEAKKALKQIYMGETDQET